MKSVIDHQELRIQKNMMEIELENLCMENNTNMEKKISSGTTTSEHIWEDYSVDHIGEEWGVFHRTESIERDLSSFLD